MKMRQDTPATRRAVLGGAAVAGAAIISAPYIRNAEAAETTTWKVQTSWPAGVGLNTFKTWAASIKEKTGGELEFKPFAAKEVVGDFELLDGVKNGVLEAMNSFTVYWVGKVPATAFLSSYLMGLRYPHEWDVFFYGKDGLKMAREIFAKQNIMYVGRIHHGPNIIHSKKPIRSIEDFKDLKLRVPGGMIAEGFAAIGAKTTLASRRRSVLGAGEGHDRGGRLHRPGRELGSRLPAGHEVHLDGTARTRIDLSAGRPDGLLRRHEPSGTSSRRR